MSILSPDIVSCIENISIRDNSNFIDIFNRILEKRCAIIGEGSFGCVLQFQKVALKVPLNIRGNPTLMYENEVNTIHTIEKFMQLYPTRGLVSIQCILCDCRINVAIMPLAFGTLCHIIQKTRGSDDIHHPMGLPPLKNTSMRLQWADNAMGQLVEGLSFMHSIIKHVHGDLSSNNILVHRGEVLAHPRVEICDFGNSYNYETTANSDIPDHSTTTMWYASPEQLMKTSECDALWPQATPSDDIWSLALDIACKDGEILSGEFVFGNNMGDNSIF